VVAGKHEREMNATASMQRTTADLIDEFFFITFSFLDYLGLNNTVNLQNRCLK